MSQYHRNNPDQSIDPGYFDRFKPPTPHDEREAEEDVDEREEARLADADRRGDIQRGGL